MPEAKQYKVLVGINYVPTGKKEEVRAEPDDIVKDLPAAAAKWMLEQNVVEEVK
jgi:hypothetical protein